MKRKFQLFSGIAVLFVTLIFAASCNDDNDNTDNPDTPGDVTLTPEEKEDLLTLREEEKLARDVYFYAYDKYALNISNNISKSEQRHMDEVLVILNAYNLPDPASPDTGVFNNATLQELYDVLVAQVDVSLIDALLVGATIEDLDIRDIEDFKLRTDKTDILDMYNLLECGSRNHMRGYYGQLVQYDTTYTPQYISQQDFDAIINSDKEQCGNQ